MQSLAALMGFVDRDTEKNILDGLNKRDPQVAAEVKSLLFVFEDIINLDDRAIQRVLKEVDGKDLALSLKTANEELLQRVYKNMSTRAATTLREALKTFEEMNVRLWADRARAELARADVGTRRMSSLSPSEQRVAELAASGMTNRDAAAALFISPKTVESNLARIYRKLGIHSRAELGRHMGQPHS